MAKTVQLIQHYSIEGLDYLPGDVVMVTDADAARIVLNRLGVIVPDDTPVTPTPDPFPMYVTQDDLDEALGNLGGNFGLLGLVSDAVNARAGAEAARAGAEAVGASTDAQMYSRAVDPASQVGGLLNARFADKAAPFWARFGGGLSIFEDFDRPDIANFSQFTEGHSLKSGHNVTSDGAVSTNSIAAIVNKRLVWTDGTPGGSVIRIMSAQTGRESTRIGASVSFSAETTTGDDWSAVPYGANAVIGCSKTSFALGSVQLALFKNGIMLFVVPNPIDGPYPTLWFYEFPTPLKDDDKTEYHFYMDFDRPTSTVTVHAPGLIDPVSIPDPQFALYWGPKFSIQERRSATTDGRVAFNRIGASNPSMHDSGIGGSLSLPYSTSTYLSATPPLNYTVTDPQVDFWGAPTGGWTNSATVNRSNALMSLWNQSTGNNHRSFAVYVAPNGRPSTYLSRDGIEQVITSCGTALPPAATGVRARYEHATGNVRFYYTLDSASTVTPTWTELGTAGGVNAFPAGSMLFTPPRRVQMQVGTRALSSTLMYGGDMSRAVWSDGGATIADCDLRTVWLSSRYADPQGNLWHLQGSGWAWNVGASLLGVENRWTSDQYVPGLAQNKGNRKDVWHKDYHPSNRPAVEMFDGNSHPLSAYFPDLATAQVLYPHATALTDETDWAAIQLALNTVTSFPRGFGLLASDWRQYGTASINLPVGAFAVVNKPLTKAANVNKNYQIGSATSQGARIKYTGGDGGRIFDFDKDSVGSTLIIHNLVLEGGGIRLKGPYRGDIRLGSGCLILDTPHAAIQFEDADHAGNQVGVVGPIIQNLYTENCAGGVWQLSSTATITTLRDSRFLSNQDVGFKVNGSTDVLVENIDFTGMDATKAATGNYPYIQISANADTTNNIDIRDVRFGSEVFGTNAPPKEYMVIGETTGTSTGVGIVRLRKCAFRTPPHASISSTLARAAIKINAKVNLDIDDCDFGEFKDYLIDEAFTATETTYYSGSLSSSWGHKNTVDAGHLGPTFSRGGVMFTTPGGLHTTVDKRVGPDASDGQNLVSTDLSTWAKTNCTVGARVDGGPNGMFYFPVTKTAATAILSNSTVTLTAGKHYTFGVMARKGTMRTLRLRAAIGATVMVDQREIRLDDDWSYYWFRIPYVATTGAVVFGIYLDNDEETGVGGTMDVMLPFLSEGWTPKFPRTGLRMTGRSNAPTTPVAGMTYQADGVGWDPLGRALTLPYLVFYNGSTYQAVSNSDPGPAPSSLVSLNTTPGSAGAGVTSDTPIATMATVAGLAVGSVVRVRAYGNMDFPANPGVFNLRFRINGTTFSTLSLLTSTTTAAGTNVPWSLDLDCIVTATGAAGSVRVRGVGLIVSGNTNARLASAVSVGDTAVDLSAGLTPSITANTATGNAGSIIRFLDSIQQRVI